LLGEAVFYYKVPNPTPANKERYTVIPITMDQYSLFMLKPYSFPKRRTAWRLINSGVAELENDYVEILSRVTSLESSRSLHEYRLTYVVFPDPIILQDLEEGESIRGITIESNTNLIPSLHPLILDYAVKLAEEYYYDKYPASQKQSQSE